MPGSCPHWDYILVEEKLLILVTTRKHLERESNMSRVKGQVQTTSCCVIPSELSAPNWQIQGDRKLTRTSLEVPGLGGGGMGSKWKWHKGHLQGEGNVLKMGWGRAAPRYALAKVSAFITHDV